MLATFTE